jgi:hypothetical protein
MNIKTQTTDAMKRAIQEIERLERENAQLREDKRRLDFLEAAHDALSSRFGTNYGWELIINHNVVRVLAGSPHPTDFHEGIDLNDARGGKSKRKTCRAAIDDFMKNIRYEA